MVGCTKLDVSEETHVNASNHHEVCFQLIAIASSIVTRTAHSALDSHFRMQSPRLRQERKSFIFSIKPLRCRRFLIVATYEDEILQLMPLEATAKATPCMLSNSSALVHYRIR